MSAHVHDIGELHHVRGKKPAVLGAQERPARGYAGDEKPGSEKRKSAVGADVTGEDARGGDH
jgi:hypothetical protein